MERECSWKVLQERVELEGESWSSVGERECSWKVLQEKVELEGESWSSVRERKRMQLERVALFLVRWV